MQRTQLHGNIINTEVFFVVCFCCVLHKGKFAHDEHCISVTHYKVYMNFVGYIHTCVSSIVHCIISCLGRTLYKIFRVLVGKYHTIWCPLWSVDNWLCYDQC